MRAADVPRPDGPGRGGSDAVTTDGQPLVGTEPEAAELIVSVIAFPCEEGTRGAAGSPRPAWVSDPVGGDEQVVEAALLVRGQERLLDAAGHRRLGPQLPVGDGRRGQVDHV